ncbi:MAG: PQQ-binding-like beta-propeller repeat protein, partial [Lentisphaeria bacterium]
MLQKIAIVATFALGLIFLTMFFLSANNQSNNPMISTKKFGYLQLDSSPLGEISSTENGLIAGNSRGELRLFPSLFDKPTVFALSKYAISAAVLLHEETYYVGDENGTFWAFHPKQGILWSYKTNNQIAGKAVFANNLIWVGSYDNCLYAFDPKNGSLKFTVECDGQINSSPIISNDQLFILLASCDGKLRKICTKSAKIVSEIDFGSYIPQTPVLQNSTLFLLTHKGALAAVDIDSFQIIYQIPTNKNFFSSPFICDSTIFLTSSDGKIHLHHRDSGKFISTLNSQEKFTPLKTASNQTVFAISNSGKLYKWSNVDNNWQPSILHDFQADFRSSVTLSHATLFLADETGALYFFKEKNH